MSKLINALTDIETVELSLVNRGANRKTIALTKSERETVKQDELLKAMLEEPVEKEEELLAELLGEEEVAPEMADAMRMLVRASAAHKSEMSEELKSRAAKLLLDQVPAEKAEDEEMAKAEEEELAKEEDEEKLPLAMAEELPEELQKKVEGLWKAEQVKVREEIRKAREEAEAVRAELRKAQDAQRTKEYVEKAKALRQIPREPEVLGKLLKRADELDAELGAEVQALLGQVNELLEKGTVFKELGTQSADAADARAKIEKRREEIRKANPNLTKEQAFVQAFREADAPTREAYRKGE